jgi:hypothetical protein
MRSQAVLIAGVVGTRAAPFDADVRFRNLTYTVYIAPTTVHARTDSAIPDFP